eukprot:15454946-Alexandrium_andersonii.AAC.1
MAPNPPDKASSSGLCRFRPPSTCHGLCMARGLRSAAGLGARPDCRSTDSSRTQDDLCQASKQNNKQ